MTTNQCSARNRSGAPCKRPAAPGKTVCYMHGGANGSGAQPGNTNAMTHGFYSDALDDAELADLARAREIQGLDEEIALLRVKLKRIARLNPDNASVLIKALEALSRALVAKHRISGEARAGLDAALSQALTELSNELGIPV